MNAILNKTLPCPFQLELLAAFERLLCFCHTGNTSVFATSLMQPLGLSRSATVDGFPTLLKVFIQPNIHLAKKHGFLVDYRKWPLKNSYPAIASKKAQVLTYSLSHFMVRLPSLILFHIPACIYIPSSYLACFVVCSCFMSRVYTTAV